MGKPKMPKNMQFDPIEMIDKQAEVNRISEENPYGSAIYETQPDGTQKLVKSFSPEMQGIHEAQIARTQEGSMKNPLEALEGTGMEGLAGAMMGKLKDRYMGEEGTETSRHKPEQAPPPSFEVPVPTVPEPVIPTPEPDVGQPVPPPAAGGRQGDARNQMNAMTPEQRLAAAKAMAGGV